MREPNGSRGLPVRELSYKLARYLCQGCNRGCLVRRHRHGPSLDRRPYARRKRPALQQAWQHCMTENPAPERGSSDLHPYPARHFTAQNGIDFGYVGCDLGRTPLASGKRLLPPRCGDGTRRARELSNRLCVRSRLDLPDLRQGLQHISSLA